MDKITPEHYRQILDGIELLDIALIKLNSSINHDNLSASMKVAIKDSATFENDEQGFRVEDKYTLTSKKDNKIGLKIEAVYRIRFQSETDITDDFFDIYKSISLPLNIWPFFRELAHSVTSRMNIPPLSLPLIKR
jgi:preprotein translocase subunit SecB